MSFAQFVRFTTDAGGLEKILRFLQSLSQIIAVYSFAVEDAVVWMHLRRQFSLGRRYFRFFRFLACFTKAYASFKFPITFLAVLDIVKWSFMGAYLFLESLTILDAIGVWPAHDWVEACMLEANRLWFYSLVASICKAALDFLFLNLEDEKEDEQKGGRQEKAKGETKRDGIRRRFAADCFDLLIPGHVTGWIPSSLAVVGSASAISTLLSSKDIWDRLQ